MHHPRWITGLLAWTAVAAMYGSAHGALSVVALEHQDPWTGTKGLSELLGDLKQPFKDITATVQSGKAIDLGGADVFIVGSFCTQDKVLKTALAKAGPAMSEFVKAGGTVIVLTQTDQDQASESWVPSPAIVTRGDPDFAKAFRVQPKHPIFNAPEAITDAQLQGWEYVPANKGKPWPTSWESYTTFRKVSVLAGDSAASVTHACIIEAGWGKGRALFLSLAPDKARNVGNDQAKAQAPRLMQNLLHYAASVKAGRPAEIMPHTSGFEGPIAGRVFHDSNGNGKHDEGEPGVVGVGVSDRFDLVKTAADGTYMLANADGEAEFVYISQPSGYAKSTAWFQRLNRADQGKRFDFPLTAADESQPFSFAQFSDIHIGGSGNKKLLAAALQDLASLKNRPAFVLATGDLVNIGSVIEQYEDYVAGVATSKVPYFSVMGNHDANDRGSSNYRRFLGPDYYSFDYGRCHFLIVNAIQKTPEQRAWIQKDIEMLRGDKRLFIFQHYAPSEEDEKEYASYSAHAVFTGHWHSHHTVKFGDTASYNSPTLLFGGIDCSPAGFKVVTVKPDGISSRMRWLADGKRLTIVTPSEALLIPQGDLTIVADAYETTADYVSAGFTLKTGGTVVAQGSLAAKGEWSWHGSVPGEKITRGTYELEVTVKNDKGESSTAKSSFMVMAVRAPRTAPKEEWAQFGGGPARGGSSQASLELPLGPVWYRHSGGSFDFASPVIKEQSLYLGVRDRGDFERNGVLALKADSGEQAWFTRTPAAVTHSVAADEQRVYACSQGGIVHAFDRAGGKELWQRVLGSSSQRWQYAGPVLQDGTLYAGTFAYFGAFRAADGEPLWHQTYGGDWISSNACPAVKGDIVVVPANWGTKSLRGVKAATGETLWEVTTGGLHGSPVIAGDAVVFTTYGGEVACVDLATGQQRWKHALEGKRSASTPAVAGGLVVTGGTGVIRAFKLDGGAPVWEVPIGMSALKMAPYNNGYDAFVGSATIAGGVAYVPCGDGKLYALSLDTGKTQWCMDFGTPVLSAPCIVGDRMYVTAFDGGVYALASRKSFAPAN